MATGNDAFVTEAFVLLALAWIVIFLRTYARASSVGIKKFQLDDYWMLVAGVSVPSIATPWSRFNRFAGCLRPRDCDGLRRGSLVEGPCQQWNDA